MKSGQIDELISLSATLEETKSPYMHYRGASEIHDWVIVQ